RVRLRLRWGADRGGMFVAMTGEREDRIAVERSWELVAEGDDGPFIPAMAAAAIIGGCAAGQRPVPGARAALGEADPAAFAPLFAARRIVTGYRETVLPG